MRNRALHDQLRLFAGEAAERLQGALEAGSEIPFEVAEAPGAGSVLYRYKPLTDEFMRERMVELRAVGAYSATITALARVEGTSAYLRVQGAKYVPALEHDRAEATLLQFLCRLWEESSTFALEDSRFERAYRELEGVVYEDTAVNTVLAPLLGVRLAGERWELGSGITLARGDMCEAPPDAVWASGREVDDPNTLITLMVESTPSEPPPLTAARIAFRKLLTSLRLLKPGGASLGANAWWRTDEGPWHAVPLGFAGRSRGPHHWLEPHERAELGELFELLRSRPAQGGALPWALTRFELGCEQPVALEGLSDYLLALRAVLDDGQRSEGSIARRLAALCAEPADQGAVRGRVEQAFQLERLVMRGNVDAALMATIEVDSPDLVVRELEENLRALLRDMVCGHIDANVRGIADGLLPPGGQPDEPGGPGLFEDTSTGEFLVSRGGDPTTDELIGVEESPSLYERTVPEKASVRTPAADEGDTEDFDLDDDAADYSGAV